MTPSEFRRDLWHQKTTSRDATFVHYGAVPACDGRTDSTYHASIASRGKKDAASYTEIYLGGQKVKDQGREARKTFLHSSSVCQTDTQTYRHTDRHTDRIPLDPIQCQGQGHDSRALESRKSNHFQQLSSPHL